MWYAETDSDYLVNDNGTGETLGAWRPTMQEEEEIKRLLALLYPGRKLAFGYLYIMCPTVDGIFGRDCGPEPAVVLLAIPVAGIAETAIPAGEVWTVQQLRDAVFLRAMGGGLPPDDAAQQYVEGAAA